jgi:mannose-6-phosphate isomerase-like protein (cupin superfamily)
LHDDSTRNRFAPPPSTVLNIPPAMLTLLRIVRAGSFPIGLARISTLIESQLNANQHIGFIDQAEGAVMARIRNRIFPAITLALLVAVPASVQSDPANQEESNALLKFNIDELSAQNATNDLPYLEFMRVESMSAYIYELPAGATDEQTPHDQDEIYYVVKGKSDFTVDGGTVAIKPGDILYVKKFAQHLFSNITEDLSLLVVFAPPDTE